MSATSKMNIENYLKMSEPFASIPEADAKLVEFYTATEEARNRLGIADVYVIVKINAKNEVGRVVSLISSAHHGNTSESQGMCAWALGEESKRRRKLVKKLSTQE